MNKRYVIGTYVKYIIYSKLDQFIEYVYLYFVEKRIIFSVNRLDIFQPINVFIRNSSEGFVIDSSHYYF